MEKYQGSLIVVAAPSGGGKTSLIRNVLSKLDNLEVSISHTTRPARPKEVNGKDYYFVETAQFARMIEANEFIEYAQVFDHQYGTSKQQIIEKLVAGVDILFDIDWQGAEQIKQHFKEDVVTIFILPPSLEKLRERLTNRNQDTDSVIHSRMQKAQDEMRHYNQFDYVIINDDFEHAAEELASIVIANRLKLAKQAMKKAKLLSLLLCQQ
ncbi:guanylate kinase [Legionella sp. W05-934-2]|jgi:guanylate kinase|uniref:guanylate kinase n=1 Tax=Legionella sp. W05-934-2 TaxID=1198649 RepID=UPI0034636551